MDKQEPKVGMGATIHMYSDSHAYTIVGVTKSGKTITLQKDKATMDPNFKPEIEPGGFVGHCSNQDEQTYSYEQDPEGFTIKARLRKDGRYHSKQGKVGIGYRREFYDYNF